MVTNKDLNVFDDCAAECVHLCPQEQECTSSSWVHSKMYTLGTIPNSQRDRAPVKMNKKGKACCQKKICCQSKNFSRTKDTIRHLKTFRVNSNGMPVLLTYVDDILIVCLF